MAENEGELKRQLNKAIGGKWINSDCHQIITAFVETVEDAKKEYPIGFSTTVGWKQKDEWFKKWFGGVAENKKE